jgi:Domain of unknown function (DUF222)
MTWQPDRDDGAGAEPGRDPDLPRGHEAPGAWPSSASAGSAPDSPASVGSGSAGPGLVGDMARDDRLAGFAKDGEWNACPPSAALAKALAAASGQEWRCPGALRDEMFGLLRRWAALESWAVAAKLGVLRALIREEDQPLPGGGYHGDLPDGWTKSLTHEVALALAMPAQSAEKLMWTAWDLAAVLPGTGALLADGTLTYAKARAVEDALAVLTDDDAAKAEAMIVPQLPGKTYGQVEKLALQAAITIDPESATRRREDAERNRARVALRRDPSGAASLAGYDLPTDETLAAYANVCARAHEYKDSAAFPGVRMDQFRAMAYLDIMNGITAEARIACSQPSAGLGAPNDDEPNSEADDQDTPAAATVTDADVPAATGPDVPGAHQESDPGDEAPDGGPDGEDPGGGQGRVPDGNDPGGDPHHGGPGGGSSPASPPASSPSLPLPPPRLADLVIPLGTLLGVADRPGEGHGLGPLDPDLCRALAATAANSPHTTLCVTVTDPVGIAIGHGCARADRRRRAWGGSAEADPGKGGGSGHGPPGLLAALPARVNLTITATRLAELTRSAAPPGQPPWSFNRGDDPGPPGGFGTWTLALPDGRRLTVKLDQVPTMECDHRHESQAYQPNGTLRHLVQVRDGECTFPSCSRHAKETDFEHATPYHKGGRTCGCNAGARSRQCHQIKQSPGWNVTQPKPAWHQWETPAGRVYTQGPKRYPV